MIPQWLHILAIVMLGAGLASALVLAVQLRRHPQHMAIMNLVWPITGLYAGPLALWAYWRYGRIASDAIAGRAMAEGRPMPHKKATPFFAQVGKGTSHCGAGCTLADILVEWTVFFAPSIAVWFGYGSLFDREIFAVWVAAYIAALVIGIAFQYASIKPMNPDMAPGRAFMQAAKADILSLSAWQVGMYGAMAVAHFVVFGQILDARLSVASVEFWAAMQVAMLCGFVTAYPVNWWLVRRGIKEAM